MANILKIKDGNEWKSILAIRGEQGPQGVAGPQGPAGQDGEDGKDGLTTSISVNGTTYTQVGGLITLPNYPTDFVTTNTDQIINGAKTFFKPIIIEDGENDDACEIGRSTIKKYDSDGDLVGTLTLPSKTGTLAITSDLPIYTPGEGISLVDNEIGIDFNLVATCIYVDTHHDSTKLDNSKVTVQTTAPTSAITDGGVHIVYLTSEPATKYNGYIYLIKE